MRSRKEIETLFRVMCSQIDVMSEYADSEKDLENELKTCDNETYNYYLDFYEVKGSDIK